MTGLLDHRIDGSASAPPLVLGPSLGTSVAVWDPQTAALARSHRVIRWNLPGHGGAPADPPPESVPDLARRVLELADGLGAGRFSYAGISLGGAVGAWLAAHHPDRIGKLAIVCSAARFGEPAGWHERAALVRAEGTGALTGSAVARWFTPGFADSPAARAMARTLRAVAPEGYAACCEAIAGFDLRADLGRIGAPTLVIAGREDPATPPVRARELADGIPGAALLEIPRASHLANVERPGAVLGALLGHLDGERSAYDAGMAVRRAVLGNEHVDRAVARTTGFTAPFQDLVTRYAWGEIWTRPGLDRRTRSCVTLTALVARGQYEELAMHVRAAVRNGLTAEEIGEVLLQTAVYCGVPAANSAFAVADRVLREIAETPEPGDG